MILQVVNPCSCYVWLVGSPQTVTQKLGDMYEQTGGFGCLLALTFDQSENNEAWERPERVACHVGRG